MTCTDASGVKFGARSVDQQSVKLQRCPYDGTPLDVDAYSGGSYLLDCASCGAAWEAHNSLVRRTTEPDWERAASTRAARANSTRMEPSTPTN